MSPSVYAVELLKVAESAQANVVCATAMARRRGVAGRIRRIVAKEIDRKTPGRLFALGFGSAFAIGGLACAAGSLAKGGQRLPSTNANQAFRLKTGASVRLIYIGDARDGASAAWRPDGLPASRSEVQHFEEFNAFHLTPDPNMQMISFNFEIDNLPPTPGYDYHPIYRIKGTPGVSYMTGFGNIHGNSGFNRDLWSISPGVRTVDMDCAIASAPFRTYGIESLGGSKFHAKAEYVDGNAVHTQPTFSSGAPGQRSYWVSVQTPKSLVGKNLRIVLRDELGREYPSEGGPVDPADQNWQESFSRLPIEKIASVELQYRDIERFTFKGIRLRTDATP